MIIQKEICIKCGNEVEFQNTMFGVLVNCKESIWNDEAFRDLSDELKKDFALSLFIQMSKNATTEKIQQFKKENIKTLKK